MKFEVFLSCLCICESHFFQIRNKVDILIHVHYHPEFLNLKHFILYILSGKHKTVSPLLVLSPTVLCNILIAIIASEGHAI